MTRSVEHDRSDDHPSVSLVRRDRIARRLRDRFTGMFETKITVFPQARPVKYKIARHAKCWGEVSILLRISCNGG